MELHPSNVEVTVANPERIKELLLL